jgi:penicillin-binding protein 1A
MGGKTGTTNDNSDAWFIGYTPQLLGGVWIGCDDRFIRLESGLGYGGAAARPIWEYFFSKAFADKTLGLDRQAKFVRPDNLRNEQFYDIGNIIDHTPPPGAEGEDVGSGGADAYLGKPDTQNIPTESKEAMEEQKVLKEATSTRNQIPKDSALPSDEKKKKGFFRRLFGKRDQ